jgi:hypothetical protein
MEGVVKAVLISMSSVKKPQRLFIMGLFVVLVTFQGKATFRNLSRYCDMHEKRFSRWYRRRFDFAQFNTRLIQHEFPDDGERIAAIDASFMKKSGQKTEGLAWFYHGQLGQAMKGLELSLICTVDLQTHTAYAVDARQTLDSKHETRVDFYARQVTTLAPSLKAQGIDYLAADAYYSKVKFVDAVCSGALHMIGKLRVDADLQWYFDGPYAGTGRPKQYDGKVDFQADLDRFERLETADKGVEIYSAVVQAKTFKRKVRVVLLRWAHQDRISTALLFSTDTALDGLKIVAYYKARFQIEFLFRDAKQHTGLMDCQARCKEAIHTHINASLSALNLLKLEDRRQKQASSETVISIASWRRKKFNQHLMKILFERLGLSRDCNKVAKVYDTLSDYGAVTA